MIKIFGLWASIHSFGYIDLKRTFAAKKEGSTFLCESLLINTCSKVVIANWFGGKSSNIFKDILAAPK